MLLGEASAEVLVLQFQEFGRCHSIFVVLNFIFIMTNDTVYIFPIPEYCLTCYKKHTSFIKMAEIIFSNLIGSTIDTYING